MLSAQRHERIAAHPLCPVSVYLFASQDRFKAWCAPRGYIPDSGHNLGVYDRLHGDIATDLSGGRPCVPSTAHELAHVLMDADWDAPLWFRECVASQYESPVLAASDRIARSIGTPACSCGHRRASMRRRAREREQLSTRRAHAPTCGALIGLARGPRPPFSLDHGRW